MSFTVHVYLLVRDASPESVIWRASKLSDFRDESPDSFLKPPSVITVNDRFMLSRLTKPTVQMKLVPMRRVLLYSLYL